jgi:hypothetical protein
MNRLVLAGLGALALGMTTSFASTANAQVAAVNWELNKPYVIAGSGCVNNFDAFAAQNGNDLSIVFTNLGVNLPGNGASNQLADMKSCLVRIPASIAKGFYIGQLTQTFTYGVTKGAGSHGTVATRATFFGFPVSPFPFTVPEGLAQDDPLLTQTRVDSFTVNTPWWQGWCNPNRSLEGLYQASIAVSGQRDNSFENLILFVDGLDLKYEVVTSLFTC